MIAMRLANTWRRGNCRLRFASGWISRLRNARRAVPVVVVRFTLSSWHSCLRGCRRRLAVP